MHGRVLYWKTAAIQEELQETDTIRKHQLNKQQLTVLNSQDAEKPKAIVPSLGKNSYSLSGRDLDERINTTLTYVQ